MKLLRQLWNEDSGFVLSSEIVTVGSVLLIGMVAGLTSLRDATVTELGDLGLAIGSFNQSYWIGGTRGHCAYTVGSRFFDTVDYVDTGVVVCDQNATAVAATQFAGYSGPHGPALVREFAQPVVAPVAPYVAAPCPPTAAPCAPAVAQADPCLPCGHIGVQVTVNGVPVKCCQTQGCLHCGPQAIYDGAGRGPTVAFERPPHPAPPHHAHKAETIEMRFAHVGDEELKDIADADRVKVLHIHASQVTNNGLKQLAGLKNLEELHIGGAKIDDDGLKYIAGMKGLRVLTLHGTNVSPRGLEWLKKEVPSLTVQ